MPGLSWKLLLLQLEGHGIILHGDLIFRIYHRTGCKLDTSQVQRKIVNPDLWYNAMRLNYTRHILLTTDVAPSLGKFPCLANPAIMR